MRQFKSMMFLGSDAAYLNLNKLYFRLNEGIGILGGLQQPDHPATEEEAANCGLERIYYQQELDDIVKDIVMAFTGKEIEL